MIGHRKDHSSLWSSIMWLTLGTVYSKASLGKHNKLYSDSHLLLGIDDQQSRATIFDLTMAMGPRETF